MKEEEEKKATLRSWQYKNLPQDEKQKLVEYRKKKKQNKKKRFTMIFMKIVFSGNYKKLFSF